MDANLKRAILISHYQKPHNFGLISDCLYKQKHMASASCIDDLTIQMAFENDLIKDIRFGGVGCTISISSTSILSDLIKGKKKEDALRILQEYESMLQEKEFNEEILQEAVAFDTLFQQPNRIHCGSIALEAMKSLIKESLEDENK